MSINYNTSEYDKKYIEWLKEENRKLAEQLRWHEYPEEKPESGLYRVTLDVSPFTITRDLYYNSVTGLWENPRSGCEIVLDVIAWAELPKPYKKEYEDAL